MIARIDFGEYTMCVRDPEPELIELSRLMSRRSERDSDVGTTGLGHDLPVMSDEAPTQLPELSTNIQAICSAIDDALVDHFAQYPKEMLRLDGRGFEELIAYVLKGLGYEIELTKTTRDGGYDIRAIRHAEFHTCAIIECKRYAEHRPVSVGIVRALRAVATDLGAHGVVATTSYFSRDARVYLDEHPWLLEGRDFRGIVDWIDCYRRIRMANVSLSEVDRLHFPETRRISE